MERVENQEFGSQVKRLVQILRRITVSVQIVPFVCGALYIVAYVAYVFAPESVIVLLDTLFYVSPLFCAAHLVYSRILRLCAWHRAACLVPAFPQVVTLVDYYVVSFSEVLAFVLNATAMAMTGTLLVAAYNVFLK